MYGQRDEEGEVKGVYLLRRVKGGGVWSEALYYSGKRGALKSFLRNKIISIITLEENKFFKLFFSSFLLLFFFSLFRSIERKYVRNVLTLFRVHGCNFPGILPYHWWDNLLFGTLYIHCCCCFCCYVSWLFLAFVLLLIINFFLFSSHQSIFRIILICSISHSFSQSISHFVFRFFTFFLHLFFEY